MEISESKLHYLTSTKPSSWKLKSYKVFHTLFGWLGRRLLLRKYKSVEITGTEHLKKGPFLLLMNHSCPDDPLLITFFGGVPLQFLVSEGYMVKGGVEQTVASLFGQITKRKLDFDFTSIKLMKEWCDLGGCVATFPEGLFSWDGDPCPFYPGLEQLIKFLNVPVVTVHLANGDRIKPYWAEEQRKTKVKITINPPKHFEKDEDIIGFIKEKIFNKGHEKISFESEGSNLSAGLAKTLRYCPHCGADDSLIEVQNVLRCNQCLESWEVFADNKVKSNRAHSIKELLNISREKFERKWEKDKRLSSLYPAQLYDITKKDWSLVQAGTLNLQKNELSIGDFKLLMTEVVNHTLDWGEAIIIKTKRKRFALILPDDSRFHFSHIFDKNS